MEELKWDYHRNCLSKVAFFWCIISQYNEWFNSLCIQDECHSVTSIRRTLKQGCVAKNKTRVKNKNLLKFWSDANKKVKKSCFLTQNPAGLFFLIINNSPIRLGQLLCIGMFKDDNAHPSPWLKNRLASQNVLQVVAGIVCWYML